MDPRICRCCGENVPAAIKTVNPNVCADCERWLEDETPHEITIRLLAANVLAPAATLELPPDLAGKAYEPIPWHH
jgi:hypothetical protein